MNEEVYSILPEVQEIYNEVVSTNPNFSKEEIDAEVERLYNARKKNDDSEELEEPSKEDEVEALEKEVDAVHEKIADLEAGQEKIVSVMESLSDKIDSLTVSDKDLNTKKNDIEESEESEEASTEAPAEIVENEVETTNTEEIAEPKEENSKESTETEESVVETEPVENEAEQTDTEGTEDSETKIENAEPTKEIEVSAEVNQIEDSEEEKVELNVEESTENASEEVEENQPAVEEVEDNKENKVEETMTEEQINALIARIKNEIADEAVKAPEVEEVEEKKEDNSISKNFRIRYNEQVAAAWDAYRLKSAAGMEKLAKINAYNAELRKNDTSDGPITIDGDPGIGGFVLPPEIDTMIHGKRTDYSSLLSQIDYSETSSLQFAYATRVGDINMRPVKMCEAGGTITDDASHVRPDNLKAIEGYSLTQGLAQMEEFAAVTPICTSVTRFAAADILADVAAGYRTDYDRKLAQLFVIRLQQAVNTTDNVVEFDPASATDALIDFVKATTKVSDHVVNGKFLFNARTKAAILEYLFNSGNGGDLSTNAFTNGDVPTIFGFPYIVVPNDLLPTLGEGDVRTFVAQSLDGTTIETVDITSPVFYGDFTEYRGKVHGGLSYDVSADASYEVYNASGVTEVRSAWQRNELVLRGSFYRGGYISDPSVIAGLVPVSS